MNDFSFGGFTGLILANIVIDVVLINIKSNYLCCLSLSILFIEVILV